jgi:O-antigen ligase
MQWSKVEPFLTLAWGLVLFTLPFSHAFNSVAMVLLLILTLLAQLTKNKPKVVLNAFTISSLALFALFWLIQVTAYFWFGRAFSVLEKAPLLLLPTLWLLGRLNYERASSIISRMFHFSLLIVGMIMVLQSIVAFLQTNSLDVFVYDNLCEPFDLSPIYFSYFLLSALVWRPSPPFYSNRWMGLASNLFLVMLLMLAASKLFVFMGLVIGFFEVIKWKSAKRNRLLIPVAALMTLLAYPVSKRFLEISQPRLDLVSQDDFRHDAAINGLNLRLIQWRFAVEIMLEQEAWIFGVGPKTDQELLNEKYEQYDMYTGNPNVGDKGFRMYNFHNQFMETMVTNGLIGLFCLIAIWTFIVYAHRKKLADGISYVMMISFAFMLTESFLDRQRGVVLFAFFIAISLSSFRRLTPANV